MLSIRKAEARDVAQIVQFIQDLAAYEKLSHECYADTDALHRWLFGSGPKAHCLIAEWSGTAAGFALYFYNFSTFLCKPGLYVEDVYVMPEFRRRGIARALFKALAQKAVAEECGRLEWWVLDWNTPAIDFYRELGAVPMNEWTVQRITGDALHTLAASDNTSADGERVRA